MQNNHDRISLLKKFVNVEADLRTLEKQITAFGWDYDGDPMILDRNHLKTILSNYLQGKMTGDDVVFWAEFLELRDDIDYSLDKGKTIASIVHCLANPDLEGELTIQKANELLADLN